MTQKKKIDNTWEVYIDNGREPTGKDVIEWAKQLELLGAGEIMLTPIDREGTKKGFDIELNKMVCESITIPIISCGGAGKNKDVSELILNTDIDAVAIASILHYNIEDIPRLKECLNDHEKINVRL